MTARTSLLRGITAVSLPWHTSPVARHVVLILISAQGNSHSRVIAVLDSPLANVMSHAFAITAIEFRIALGRIGVWRIKEHSRESLLDRWRRTANALPVATANANAGKAISEGLKPFDDF